MPLKTPDITTAQIIAIAGAALGLVVALGVPLSDEKQHAITTLVTVLAPVLLGADAAIRHGRARSVGLAAAAAAATAAVPAPAHAAPVALPSRPIAGWDPEHEEGEDGDEENQPAAPQPEDEPEQPQEPPEQSVPKPWPEEALAR